jgi:hypothetical protein
MQISGFKIMLFGLIVMLFGGLLHLGIFQSFGGIPVIIGLGVGLVSLIYREPQ